jgi:hypothetical protein
MAYLTNKELLSELQRSKATYCYFVSPEYIIYHEVLPSIELLTPEYLDAVITKKASKASTKLNPVDPKSIDPESIVFRVMTDEHLPPETDEKRRRKSNTTGEWVAKPNFPPFKHYILKDSVPTEVGRSHWKDGLHNGHFNRDHGRMTNKLAQMFMLLVENLSHKGNWRGYTYCEEFRGQALVHLMQVGLQFDESRSSNPFAFYTQIIKHCFTRILNLEKRHQSIRDDVLIMAGVQPSYSRQIDNEFDQRQEAQVKIASMNDIHVVGAAIGSDPEANLIKKEMKKRGRKKKID